MIWHELPLNNWLRYDIYWNECEDVDVQFSERENVLSKVYQNLKKPRCRNQKFKIESPKIEGYKDFKNSREWKKNRV